MRVIHCPHSNMKLASGVCPVTKFRRAGAVVGIGTDGAASNNGLDMFAETRLAALLAKSAGQDTTALPATDALAMATLGSAQALGMADQVGFHRTGQTRGLGGDRSAHPEYATVCTMSTRSSFTARPAARVTHTFVGGQCVYENGEWATMDIDAITRRAEFWRDRLAAHR